MTNKFDNYPVLPFFELVHIMIRKLGKHGNIPGQPVTLPEMHAALQATIQRTNGELLKAASQDAAAALRAKIEMLKNEENKILDGGKAAAIEYLLRGRCVCLAYLNGNNVLVPPNEFAGDVDWENESLRSADRTYTRLRPVLASRSTPEQIAEIQRHLSKTQEGSDAAGSEKTPISTGTPGRPTSIHLVEAEFHRRAKQNLTLPTLAKEADALAEWLQREHPNAPPATAKTIKNRLRGAYWKSTRHKPIHSE